MRRFVFLVLVLLLVPVSVQANDFSMGLMFLQDLPYPGSEEGIVTRHEFGGVSEAKVGDSDGKYSFWETHHIAAYDRFYVGYDGSFYDWRNVSELPLGNGGQKPWDSLNKITLGARVYKDEWEHFTFDSGVEVTSAFESQLDDSYGGGVWAIFGGKFVDDWVLPVVWGRYKGISPRDGTWLGHLDLGVNILIPTERFLTWLKEEDMIDEDTRNFMDVWIMFYSRDDFYRLSDTSPVKQKGYVETRSQNISLVFDFNITENFTVRLSPEYRLDRQFLIYDRTGSQTANYKNGDAFGGTAGVVFRF